MCTSSSCDSRFNVIAGLTCYNNYFKWDGGFTGLVIFDLLCNILLSVINLNNLLGPRSVWLFHIDYSQLSLKLIYTDTMTLNIKLKIKFISHTNKLSVIHICQKCYIYSSVESNYMSEFVNVSASLWSLCMFSHESDFVCLFSINSLLSVF